MQRAFDDKVARRIGSLGEDMLDTITTQMHSADAALGDITAGFLERTKVATLTGWRVIEGIVPGDKVLTFDEGFQTVRSVGRHIVGTFGDREDPAHWPLFVPEGAMGNRADMMLLPDQAVTIESDLAERIYGDPFVMIPAKSLEGYRGIRRIAPPAEIAVFTLHFDDDQVVFANMGALFHCPAQSDLMSTLLGGYEVMSLAQADLLVALMELDEQGLPPTPHALAALRHAA